MTAGDFSELQTEFSKGMSESSAGLTTAEAEASKAAGVKSVGENVMKSAPEWMSPAILMNMVNSAAVAARRRELISLAPGDLPGLISKGGPQEFKKAARRWARSSEKLIREVFGLPSPSESRRFLHQGQNIFKNFSAILADASNPFRSYSGFYPVPEFFGGHNLFRIRPDSFDNTAGKLFRIPSMGLTRQYEERAKRAVEDHMKFLGTLPELQDLVIDTSKKAINRIVINISQMEEKEPTTYLYKTFYDIRLQTDENEYFELFKSDVFFRTLAKRFIPDWKRDGNFMRSCPMLFPAGTFSLDRTWTMSMSPYTR